MTTRSKKSSGFLGNLSQQEKIMIAGGGALLLFLISSNSAGAATPPPPPPNGGITPPGGLASISYLGQTGLPRGMRNNNPGNLRKSSSAWQGKITNGTDSAFEQFTTFAYGTRAMIKLLSNYIHDGYNTLDKIINRYAPAADNNNPGSYIADVAFQSGLFPTKVLTADKDTLRKLVIPMADVENGRNGVISNEMFDLAYSML